LTTLERFQRRKRKVVNPDPGFPVRMLFEDYRQSMKIL
jgi:hypothetical protein